MIYSQAVDAYPQHQKIMLPEGAVFRHIGVTEQGRVYLYYEVTQVELKETISIFSVKTEQPIPPEAKNYLGTIDYYDHVTHYYYG